VEVLSATGPVVQVPDKIGDNAEKDELGTVAQAGKRVMTKMGVDDPDSVTSDGGGEVNIN
jgi:hypothetical protein